MESKNCSNKFLTSWDDARIQDIDLALMLNRYNIPAIFYIPNNCDLNEDQIEWLSNYHQIGGHTKTHPSDMKLLSDEQLKDEIEGNKKWLEDIIGWKITSFCYPRGRFDEGVKKAVKNAGYLEARTTRVMSLCHPDDKFETDTALHLTYPWRKEYEGDDVFNLARQYVNDFSEGKIENLHFWGHGYEVTKYSLEEELEQLLKYISLKLRR